MSLLPPSMQGTIGAQRKQNRERVKELQNRNESVERLTVRLEKAEQVAAALAELLAGKSLGIFQHVLSRDIESRYGAEVLQSALEYREAGETRVRDWLRKQKKEVTN
jgi:hypothetical protein